MKKEIGYAKKLCPDCGQPMRVSLWGGYYCTCSAFVNITKLGAEKVKRAAEVETVRAKEKQSDKAG